jgi:hypothetical protein
LQSGPSRIQGPSTSLQVEFEPLGGNGVGTGITKDSDSPIPTTQSPTGWVAHPQIPDPRVVDFLFFFFFQFWGLNSGPSP